MATRFGAISIGTSPKEIISANNSRQGLFIVNNSSQNLYIGPNDKITTTNTIFVQPNGTFDNTSRGGNWRGVVFGVVDSDSSNVRFWEWDA